MESQAKVRDIHLNVRSRAPHHGAPENAVQSMGGGQGGRQGGASQPARKSIEFNCYTAQGFYIGHFYTSAARAPNKPPLGTSAHNRVDEFLTACVVREVMC